jgi:hypothetical protein
MSRLADGLGLSADPVLLEVRAGCLAEEGDLAQFAQEAGG